MVRTFRIFLSSPGDVADDRARVRGLLLGLAPAPLVRRRELIDVVSWDDPHAPAPMGARLTTQQLLDRRLPTPAECDLTIVLLWSQLGTPLKKADGTYLSDLSATQWEFEHALAAGKPVLVYRRADKVPLDPDDVAFEEKAAQKRSVDAFFTRFARHGGAIQHEYTIYGSANELIARVEQDVNRYLLRTSAGDAGLERPQKARVYLSSTLKDLKDERRAVVDALGDQCDVRTGYRADEGALAEGCLDDLAACDLYIGILGLRYGFVPGEPFRNPGKLSITELEYRRAAECGIPRLVLVKAESAIPYSLTDAKTKEHPPEKIDTFRSQVSTGPRAAAFSNLVELEAQVRTTFYLFKDNLGRGRRMTQVPGDSHPDGLAPPPGTIAASEEHAQKPRARKRASPQPPAASGDRRIFLCYRREDSGIIVGRIYDRLSIDFGRQNVFKDVDNIPFGVDFVDRLDGEVQKCTVLFAVIGRLWLDGGPSNEPRLNDPNDFVRIEIASALRRNIPVVPLLVDGAHMPRVDQLPDEIKPLARRHGTEIRHDPDFHGDMSRLLSRLG